MKDHNLNPPDFYKNEAEENEPIEENSLDSILNCFAVIDNKYDRVQLRIGLKMLLNYSNEPGINLSDVRQLLSEIIENL